MPLNFKVPAKKILRVIVDTDADCEVDDPYAIAHALMSPKFDIRAIFAEQSGGAESTRQNFEEIGRVLDAMSLTVPVYMGVEGNLADAEGKPFSPASAFLVEEAMRESESPLFVLCYGAITNVAAAIREHPEIIPRMTVVWIGGHAFPNPSPAPFKEFNAGNDVPAANIVFGSGVKLWLVPNNVYGSMRISIAELQKRVSPCGKIGKYLYEKLATFNDSDAAWWTPGESWSLGDNPAVGVALDPDCGTFEYREAPIMNPDTSYTLEPGRPMIRVYTSINSRFILEDFIAKLELNYG